MTTARFCGLVVAVAVGLAAQAVRAQETDEGDTTDLKPAGTVTWTFGGAAKAFVTTSSVYDTIRIGSAAVYPAEPEGGAAPRQVLDIGAFETPDGGAMLSVTLEFTADPMKDGVPKVAQYFPDVAELPFWTSGAEGAAPLTITLDSYSFDGTSGKVAGRFEAALCKAADWEAAADPKDCTAVSGRFETEVYPGL